MKTFLFNILLSSAIAVPFIGMMSGCSDEDENRFRPGSAQKPEPVTPEEGLDYTKLTAENHPRLLMNATDFTVLKDKISSNTSENLTGRKHHLKANSYCTRIGMVISMRWRVGPDLHFYFLICIYLKQHLFTVFLQLN